MAWDVSKRPPRIKLWEGAVFALLPILVGLVVLGQYLGVSGLLVGVVFIFVPIVFGLCMLAIDDVRNR